MKTGNEIRAWVLVIGILLIMGLSALGVVVILRQSLISTQQAIQPVNALTSNLATQVAQFLNPTPTVIPDPVTIISAVRELARLETVSYTVEKVITAETRQGPFGFLFGDRLILIAHGIVLAGVDMAKLMPEDLQLKNGVLYVDLPETEVFITTLDNQKTYIYNRDTGVLIRRDVNLETDARQAAEVEISRAALEDGILDKARINAENYLYRLLRELGYPEVIYIPAPPTPSPED